MEFVCIDTSLAQELPVGHYFEDPKHREWLEHALPSHPDDGPRWRIPFSHHPTYCAGPHHPNTENMITELVPLFQRSGVRVAFAGHEHNFQLSRADGIAYFLSGAGGKLREEPPQNFADAHTEAWSAQSHLLHVHVDDESMTVTPYAGSDPYGRPHPMTAQDTHNRRAGGALRRDGRLSVNRPRNGRARRRTGRSPADPMDYVAVHPVSVERTVDHDVRSGRRLTGHCSPGARREGSDDDRRDGPDRACAGADGAEHDDLLGQGPGPAVRAIYRR